MGTSIVTAKRKRMILLPKSRSLFPFQIPTSTKKSFKGHHCRPPCQLIIDAGDITEATEATISVQSRVKILIMDEISFMSVKHLQLISKCLQQLFDCASPFGGLSV
jgi:hypothetical protein